MGLGEQVRNGFTNAWNAIGTIKSEIDQLKGKVDVLFGGEDELKQIEGRRIFYTLHDQIEFDIGDDGLRGDALTFEVSQDGPFISTHYPMAIWRPSQPANATALGLWRPVTTYPLAAQAVDGAGTIDLNEDLISISYEVQDGGSQRNFQNAALPPLLSTPMCWIKLPRETLWTPNSVINFIPTYRRIVFNSGETPPTHGILEVIFPGYRIVNM